MQRKAKNQKYLHLRKIKNICICLLLFFFAFAIMIRYRRCGALAQLVARDIRIVEVRGSTPLCSTKAAQIRTAGVFHQRNVRVGVWEIKFTAVASSNSRFSLAYSKPNSFFSNRMPSVTAFTRCVPIAAAHFSISSISCFDRRKPIFSVRGLSVGRPIFFSPIIITSSLDLQGKT